MSYYYRGNLAVELEKPKVSSTRKKRTVVIKSAIPMQEKLLYLLFVCIIVSAAGFVGYRYVQISEFNYQIQTTKIEIASVQEKNAALQLKIDKLGSRDQIGKAALADGMSLNPGSVRVINPDSAAPKKTVVKANY